MKSQEKVREELSKKYPTNLIALLRELREKYGCLQKQKLACTSDNKVYLGSSFRQSAKIPLFGTSDTRGTVYSLVVVNIK